MDYLPTYLPATYTPAPPTSIFSRLDSPSAPRPSLRGFMITLRHTTLVGLLWTIAKTSPDNTPHSQQTDVRVKAGFEPAITAR